MGISLGKSDAEMSIALEGKIDIACAADLKALLLEALQSGNDVVISFGDATGLDVTALQLLWAAGQQARHSGMGFRLSGQVPEPVSTELVEAGFQPFSVWVHAG